MPKKKKKIQAKGLTLNRLQTPAESEQLPQENTAAPAKEPAPAAEPVKAVPAPKAADKEPAEKPARRGRPRKNAEETAAAAPAKKTMTRKPKAAKPKEEAPVKGNADNPDRLFALDIGTRSVIGIVAERDENGQMKIIATERQEHKTRAMLDGQIHDVPQVAAIIQQVKRRLVEQTGPLKSAAVAAAGRALYTMTAEAELDVDGVITQEQQRGLDFAGVQAAQGKLAASHTIDDPTRYYCVGYSTIRYVLDDIPLKMLVGQRGKKAKATVIATFLPRQVIDSMQSALHESMLDMRALTLEPIAAINVLIPPTMRHLNLVLVDIGAGTSDVAITKNGSVIAYGMVPLAGDEITEAISQKFLLDFNVAEEIKRKAANGEGSSFHDILGSTYDLQAPEIIEPILSNIQGLANAIAKQILDLNGNESPQAVMLVGGGSLTPMLQQFVANALSMPENRVAVRHPDQVEGIVNIPESLQLPDAVTPLGILKIASLNTLHFLSVYVNDMEYSLFHFRDLTVSDALLSAGIQLRKFNGHPGMGLMVTIDGERKTFPGTMGTLAQITIDGEPATLDTPIHSDCHISIVAGENGKTAEIRLSDVMTELPSYSIYVNGKEEIIKPRMLVNGQPSEPDRLLADGDTIECKAPKTIGEALRSAGYPPTGERIRYQLNGRETHYSCSPEILINDMPVTISQPINEGDHIEYIEHTNPKIGDILDISEMEASTVIYYNNEEYKVPSASVHLELNGRPANPNTIVSDGSKIRYTKSERRATTVSDALLAVDFQPPVATSRMTFTILVNKRPADFTDPVKNGDTLDVILQSLDQPEQIPDYATLTAPPELSRQAMPAAQVQQMPHPANPATSPWAAPSPKPSTAQPAQQPQQHKSPFSAFRTLTTSAPDGTQKPRKPSIADFIRHD